MIHATGQLVPAQTADMGNTAFTTQAVAGTNSSLMIATRPPGYHSRPHTHDCEQLNWLQAGELWVFIEDRAFHLHQGDFLRVPPGARHWSWNRGEADCTLVEVHSPGLQHDPLVSDFLVELFDDTEPRSYLGSPTNAFLPEDSDFDPKVAESQVE